MRKLPGFSAVVCTGFLLAGLAAGSPVPTNNPVAAYYSGPEGYPAWTDDISWSRAIDLSQYAKGKTNFEKFENARDELAAAGGGVLYYPAGTYDFSDGPFDGPAGRGLMLRRGVVIRGEAPSGTPHAARDGKLALKTHFVFGTKTKAITVGGTNDTARVPRDWNLIGLAPEPGQGVKSVDRVGVCWVHLTGGVIYFGPELVWGPTWKESKSWKSDYAKAAWRDRKPDGTHPVDPFMGAPGTRDGGRAIGSGRGRLVFGCLLDQSALLNDYDTCGRAEARGGFGETGFHMAKFVARITAYGSQVLVANNCLPRSEGNFRYDQTTVKTAPGSKGGNSFRILETRTSVVQWDYGRTMGLDINKELLGMTKESATGQGGNPFLEEGVVVRDNWIWNHGHKGFNVSGKWMTVCNNRNDRTFQKGGDDIYGLGGNWRLTLDGFIEANAGGGGMISDNLSRAFDLGGWCVWVDGNTFNNTGSSPGNDGEGILCQAHGGTHLLSWAITRNRNEGSIGGKDKGFMGGWNVDCLGLLAAWNETGGFVGTLYRKGNRLADTAIVANQSPRILPRDDKKADLKDDGVGTPIYENPAAKPPAPTNVQAVADPALRAVRVCWTDGGAGEIGFRVERKIGAGPWHVIAYRPPRLEGCEENPQVWVDFLAPSGKPLVYRVVAVRSEDTDEGAGAPTAPMRL